MVRKKVVRRVINKYTLKHGDWININILKFISAKEKIELNDLIAILGITSSNGWRLKQNSFNQARINIFNSEEMKAIKVKINNEVIGKQEITEKNLERISKKYKINENIISKILIFNKEKDTRIKRGRKYINLKKLQDEKELINELSKEFSRKNAKRIQNICWSITKKYCYYSHLHSEREDIAQEAFLLIIVNII